MIFVQVSLNNGAWDYANKLWYVFIFIAIQDWRICLILSKQEYSLEYILFFKVPYNFV